jgi:hypothetical protein
MLDNDKGVALFCQNLEGIEEAGGVIPNQIVGPEITNPEDRER